MIKKLALFATLLFSGYIAAQQDTINDKVPSLSLSTEENSTEILEIEPSQTLIYEQKLEENKKFFYQMLFYSGLCKALRHTLAKLIIANYTFYQLSPITKNQTMTYYLCCYLFKLCSLTKKALPLIGIVPFIRDRMWDKRIIADRRILLSYIKGFFVGVFGCVIPDIIIDSQRGKNIRYSNNGTRLY